MEIISQILETVKYNRDGMGVTPTILIYEVFLSSAQLKEYLTALTIHDLLNYNLATRRYGITKKGLHYLELQNKLGEIIKEEEEKEELEDQQQHHQQQQQFRCRNRREE